MDILYHHITRGQDVEQVHILSIVNALRFLGHNVKIISPPGADPEKQRNPSKLDSSRYVFSWSMVARKIPKLLLEVVQILYNLIAYLRIRHAYIRSKFDCIYERYALFSFAGPIFAKRHNIPIILEINTTTSIGLVRPLRLKHLADYIQRKVFSASDALITVSSNFKRSLVENGVPSAKVWVMHNGVDLKLFSPTVPGLPIRKKYNLDNRTVVGFVGSMVPWQGLQSLLECAGDLVREHSNICFLLVGNLKNLPPESMKIARELNSHIILTGRVPHDKIPGYIATMDMAIMPNSNSYNSPVKIFEYMAMGKATIAPDLGPLREVIKHGINGLLIRPGDPEDIKSKIMQLVSNSQLREELGRNAAKFILSNHTWDINSRKITRIFNILHHRNTNGYCLENVALSKAK